LVRSLPLASKQAISDFSENPSTSLTLM